MPQIPLIVEPDPDDPGCATVMVDGTVAGRPYRFILRQADWFFDFPARRWMAMDPSNDSITLASG